MKVTIYFLTKNTRFLCQRKIMPYPCQYFCMRVCPILTILKNWIFVSKEFSKNGKKEITWHVDKLDFDEIGPTQPSFGTLPDFYHTNELSFPAPISHSFSTVKYYLLFTCISPTILNQPNKSNHDCLYILFNNNARFSKADKTSKLWLKIFKFLKSSKTHKAARDYQPNWFQLWHTALSLVITSHYKIN